jgi:spermidine/putrescine transport system ATP-binding protein
MLKVTGVSKSFDGRPVLHPLDFDAQAGEFVSLLGPSGCGKTTLLRLIAGLEAPDSGQISLNSQDITSTPSHLRDVHTVFQRYALFPHLNVYDNVAFGPRCRGVSAGELHRQVTELLEMVGLQDYAQRPVHKLSGGEQQRVALIRALINRPQLVLLDEPMAALDAKLKLQLQGELVVLQKKFGITFVYVTHDQQEALNMSDRVAIMNRGRIEQMGTPMEVYEFPKSFFVANFVGTLHSLPGKLVDRSGSFIRVEVPELGEFSCETAGDSFGDKSAFTGRIGLRPEKLRMGLRRPSDSAENWIHGHVAAITYLGTHTQTEVTLKNGLKVSAFQQNSERKSRKEVQVGDEVFLSWSPVHSHFFPNVE